MTAVVEPMGGGETIEKLSSTLLWRIENISYWQYIFRNKIQSLNFKFLNIGNCRLYLFLKSEKDDDKKFSCRLRFSNDLSPLDYEWSLLDGDGLPVVTRLIRNATIGSNQYVDFLDWPTYEEVFRVEKSSFLTNDTLILRCRFWNSDKNFEHAEYISAYTRIRAAETSFLWRIKKFSSLQLDQELVIPFVLDFSGRQFTFKLKFSLKGHSLTNAVMSFEIIREDNKTWKRLITTLSILDHEKRTMKSFTCTNIFKECCHPSEQVRHLPEFVSRQNVMDRKSDWLHDDDITLLCSFHSVKRMEWKIIKSYKGPENLKIEIPRSNKRIPKNASIETKITYPTCTTSTVSEKSIQTLPQYSDDSKIPQHETKSVATLQQDFLSLYTDHTLSDFELRSGDSSIPVHKNVLSARSSFFKAMFCGEMKEASSGDFLDVPDLDADTLNRMLTYMYTGTLDQLEWDNAAKLYYAADKFQVQSLKHECLHLLQSGISVRNVSDILKMADRYQDKKDLELFVHDFLVEHFEEVVLFEEGGKFLNSNSTLAENVKREVYKKKLENVGK